MKLTTKERIVNSTLQLLNEIGLKNIRLQNIADRVGISVGNLAYHFADFSQLFHLITTKTLERLNPISGKWDSSVYFIDFDNKLTQYYHLMVEYKYYFIDAVEIKRTYPEIFKKRTEYRDRFKKSLKNLFKSKAKDHFLCFENELELEELCDKIWNTSSLWMIEKELDKNAISNDLSFRKIIWNHINVYFSEEGRMEFEIIILPKLE